LVTEATDSPIRRRESSYINQSDYLWIVSCFRDNHPSIRMAHQQHRAILQSDGTLSGGKRRQPVRSMGFCTATTWNSFGLK